MPPFLRSQARSAAPSHPSAALRPASTERIQALQDFFNARDLMDLDPASESSLNVKNKVAEHDLDKSTQLCGQILVEMSKAKEHDIEAGSAGQDVNMADSDDESSAGVALEEPPCHEPTNWLNIPNELKDMVIEQYILAAIADKSTRPEPKHCGRRDETYLHLRPGQFATWAKEKHYNLGLLRTSIDLRTAASRIVDGLVAQKQDEFKKIAKPMSCGSPTCCHYWTDAAFEKAHLLSLQAFCRGKTAWEGWKQNTE
jgi:hypothetical protein